MIQTTPNLVLAEGIASQCLRIITEPCIITTEPCIIILESFTQSISTFSTTSDIAVETFWGWLLLLT